MSTVEIVLVRHGQSVGNVARELAEADGDEVIALSTRDPDVPLSELGRRQAAEVGDWLRSRPVAEQPQQVWASPFVRARQTAQGALDQAGLDLPVRLDERLRDRELGVLDMLTWLGIKARYPQEAERKAWLGKLYYRPPGGESWADIALRIRSFLTELDRPDSAERVLVFAHDVVILLWRYVCEQLTEAELFEVTRTGQVRNASLTTLVRDPGAERWKLRQFNDCGHLRG